MKRYLNKSAKAIYEINDNKVSWHYTFISQHHQVPSGYSPEQLEKDVLEFPETWIELSSEPKKPKKPREYVHGM